MQKGITFPDPVEKQGVRETFVGPYSLPKKIRSNKYTRGRWSCRLKEGNSYAYWQEFYFNKPDYYHVLSIDDEDLLDMLDYWDLMEERGDRKSWDNISFAQLNHAIAVDENGDALDPLDKEEYREWVDEERSTVGRSFPLKAETAIVHSIIERLSPADQRVYEYMFDGNMTEAEIKQAFELKHSAWSNEKRRFLDKVRQVFIELGYDVPTQEEVDKQARQVEKDMKAVEKARREEAKMGLLGKSIKKELSRVESTTKPRAFAAEDQAEEDRLNGLDDPDEDESNDKQ